MVRSRNLVTWGLIGVGAFAGCRVGYDEILVVEENAAGEGGTGALGGTSTSSGATGGSSDTGGSGGSSGSSGETGGTESGGEAGAEAAGGTAVTGGSAGSAASGGSAATGDEGGAPASGGGGGTGDSAGGTGGGAAGTSGGETSGASGGSGDGGASDGGIGGTSGVSGSGGALGSGGFAGAASLGDCRTDTFGGHAYVFCNVNIAWTVARDNCASIGMLLVRVDDAAESQWVYDNVYDAPPRQGVWIGASDLAKEGEWRWTDGTLFWLGDASGSAQNGLFSAWYSTQPSGQEPRDCAALDGNTLGWYDLDCATPQPYACESP